MAARARRPRRTHSSRQARRPRRDGRGGKAVSQCSERRELDNQEDFLVLSGACIAVVEGEEYHLGQWDFVHCPPGSAHAFLAVGDEPCVIFMCGGRRGNRYVFVRDEAALRHRIGVEVETTDQAEAYAALPKWQPGTPAV